MSASQGDRMAGHETGDPPATAVAGREHGTQAVEEGARPPSAPAAAGDRGNDLQPREADAIDRVVRVVLGSGLVVSSVLLVAGFIVWAVSGAHVAASVHGPISAARELVRLQPIGFFSLGLLVLILTPFARVIGTLAAFVKLHDWRYALVATGVFAAMVTALVIAVL